jgi:DNA-binding NarL/FixJ family response regulator
MTKPVREALLKAARLKTLFRAKPYAGRISALKAPAQIVFEPSPPSRLRIHLAGSNAVDQLVGKRQLRKLGHVLVAFTANAMQGDREKCYEAGMDDSVSKPVKLENLAAAIERSVTQKPEKQGTFSAPASTPTPAATLLDAAG